MLLFWLLCASVRGAEFHIKNVNDFRGFISQVGYCNSFAGTTVTLDTDIDMSYWITPIGAVDCYFKGTFDGRGYSIRNTAIVENSKGGSGLFYYTQGATVKNLVIDSSCTVNATPSDESIGTVAGAIIGWIKPTDRDCFIEGCVNMASISYNGNSSNRVTIGGIVGRVYHTSYYNTYISNCANYGSISYDGSSNGAYIGGIIGGYDGMSQYTKEITITGCLNYGKITGTTTSTSFYIGGITGRTKEGIHRDCVSAGKITVSSANAYVGTIIGYLGPGKNEVTRCYWTSDVNYDEPNALSTGTTTVDSLTSQVEANSTIVSLLSKHTGAGRNNWLLNKGNKSVTFKLNDGKGYSVSSQLIAVQYPKDPDYIFLGWYTDGAMKTQFSSSEITSNTTFYGLYYCKLGFNAIFDFGNGTRTSKKVKYGEEYGELPKEIWYGHIVVGWFTKKNGGEEVKSSTKVTALGEHELFALWAKNNYTVTFMSDGKVIKNDTLTYGTNVTYPENQTKAGYSFIGWDKTITQVPYYNVVITALFTPHSYNVTFNANKGTTDTHMKTVIYDNAYGDLPTATRAGYAFAGWFTAAEGGEEVKTTTKVTLPNDHTLYAHWTLVTFVVTFEGNSGTPSKQTITVSYLSTYGNLPAATRAGYDFVGWFTAAEGGEEVKTTTKVTLPNDHTLYAHWTPGMFVVTFDAMGGSLSVTTKNVTYKSAYGELPTPTRIGYEFTGWYTEMRFGIEISSYDTFSKTSDQVLYADWRACKYTVTFDPVNGTINVAKKEVTYEQEYGSLPWSTKAESTFLGWFTAITGGDEIEYNSKVLIPANHTLYAHWNTFRYKLIFIFEDGTTITKNYTLKENIDYSVIPPKEGYITKYSTKPDKMPGSSLTIYITYARVITVTFNGNGGYVSFSSMNVTCGEKYETLPTATRKGWEFGGWNTKGGCTGYYIYMDMQVDEQDDLTVYACWWPLQCTITFYLDDWNMFSAVYYTGNEIRYPDTTKHGYTFVGWFIDRDYTIPFTETTATGIDTTIYAKYEPNPESEGEYHDTKEDDKGGSWFSFSLAAAPLIALNALLI